MKTRFIAIALGIVAAWAVGCSRARPARPAQSLRRPDLGVIEWRGGRIPLRAAFDRGGPLAPAQASFGREFGGGILWAGERPEPARAPLAVDRRLPPFEIDARLLEP